MTERRWHSVAWMVACAFSLAAVQAADIKTNQEFAQKATWQIPTPNIVRDQALAWIAAAKLEDSVRAQLEMLWASAAAGGNESHLVDLLAGTFAAGDPRAKELFAVCSQPRKQIALPSVDWLAAEGTPSLERHNLRLLYGRWLVQEALYDEALEQLGQLKPEEVADPATLLFYQVVVHHRTLAREPGLQTIARLLERESEIPKRYTSVARLMQADLSVLKDESLDHIARRMDDIRRRLDLGRAGPKVRQVEDGVIASLDKLIEQLEKQQQAMAAAAAAGGGTLRPSKPAQDSVPMGGKGAGEVTKKPIGNGSGWGELPPRQRQEALQQIGKDYPAHYRDMIEQYFRKLASESSENNEK
ncbi:MAG TPA: hypothetical protein VGZ26_08535 [Pirellulales bacterium]|jgi:hypothetical protein|nr:hypothetical protein [Pirellulales bacterium]